MAANASSSEMDYTCPVCYDIFKDPVVLLCGHSFCKHCLQEWWRQSGHQKCPVCKQMFVMTQPPRNLSLRDVCEALRQEKTQRANSRSTEICRLHREKLKLFCQDDRQLICVICRDAHKHKKHNIVPIDEAVEACKLQAQQTERTIKEEFQKLYQFLQAEEAARMDAVRKEAKFKSGAMDIRIVNLTAEISSLTDKIKAIETEMKAADISFMMNIKSTIVRSQCNLPDPETPSGALIDEAKHVGNLLFTVWKKMKDIIQYTPVTLDPNTGSSLLIISEHMTRSTNSDKEQPLPENPERLRKDVVLGSEGFSSGKHSWDVEVGGYWTVGVAARIEGSTSVEVWGIYRCVCTDSLCELYQKNDIKIGSKHSFPKKVSVQLDYDQGIISFFDLDRKTLVHTIKYTFTETVFPYFSENAKLLPAEFSVKIRKPR
ncbi:zinc-binding protein A33-like isoform X2 [Anarhichas minor]|uniref:zinc-binding protein A33-like isoform X2 n=1 Tax=Anarhichas minor TaxID=65739 RepID=UPI003F734FA3